MRKSIVFISVVLTTFGLVMLYNVVSAYREARQVVETSTQPAATPVPIATDLPAPIEVTAITPELAGELAVQAVGNNNLLSAESAEFNGVNAYKITFTNNDVVYIGLDGQILSVQVAPVVVNVGAPMSVRHENHQNVNGNNGSQESHENEEHEEHQD